MRKSHIWLIIAVSLLLMLGVGTTVALLVASTNTVANTFTIGNVGITLTETTGNEYKIIPGATVKKDPVVTVLSGSDSCWLFVKVEKNSTFDSYCTYEVQDEWTSLPGHEGIYYQKVDSPRENMTFPILENNCIRIKDTVTKEQLSILTIHPILQFTAYGVQSDGVDTAHDAWQIINQGEEE